MIVQLIEHFESLLVAIQENDPQADNIKRMQLVEQLIEIENEIADQIRDRVITLPDGRIAALIPKQETAPQLYIFRRD